MAKSDPNLMTQAEYARHRGCSREAVRRAVKEKRISVFGPDQLIDLVLADTQWERNTRARANSSAAPGGTAELPLTPPAAGATAAPATQLFADPAYATSRAWRERADAEIAVMNAAKMSGQMLMREDIDRAMFEIGREIRDRLTSCSRRIAAEVSSITTAEACEAVIDREHRIVLELLVTSFREKVGAPPKVS